jgi:predicted NACHT family NTPase
MYGSTIDVQDDSLRNEKLESLLGNIINDEININNFLLLGNSGAGKSKFLLKFAYKLLQNFEKV